MIFTNEHPNYKTFFDWMPFWRVKNEIIKDQSSSSKNVLDRFIHTYGE